MPRQPGFASPITVALSVLAGSLLEKEAKEPPACLQLREVQEASKVLRLSLSGARPAPGPDPPPPHPPLPRAHQHGPRTGRGGDRLPDVRQGAVDGLLGLVTVLPQEDVADPLPELRPQEAVLDLLLNDVI